jgi:hypothetical protein
MSSPLSRNSNKIKRLNMQSNPSQPAILLIDEKKRNAPLSMRGIPFQRPDAPSQFLSSRSEAERSAVAAPLNLSRIAPKSFLCNILPINPMD